MATSANTGRADKIASFILPVYAGIVLVTASSMVRQWHQSPSSHTGGWGAGILDAASSIGAILIAGSIFWRIIKVGRLQAAGRSPELGDDERVRHIEGQSAGFAVMVMFVVLGLFPLIAEYVRNVSSVSLSQAALLVLMASWLGRLLWLNRD